MQRGRWPTHTPSLQHTWCRSQPQIIAWARLQRHRRNREVMLSAGRALRLEKSRALVKFDRVGVHDHDSVRSRFSCSRSVLAAARRWRLSSSPATSGYRPAAATPSPPSPLLGRPLRTIKRFVPNRAPSTTDLKQLDARRLIEKPLSAPPSVIAPRADA
jgi:hypothetical protein